MKSSRPVLRAARRPRVLLPLAALTALALAGCAAGTTTGGTGSSAAPKAASELKWDQLTGRTFVSDQPVKYPESAPASALVAGTSLELAFTEDGIAASAGCNRMAGGAQLDGSVLVLDGALATTMMACSDDIAATEAWYGQFLSGKPTLTLTGLDLRMEGGETPGTVEMAEKAATATDAVALEGTKWQLKSIAEGAAVSSVPAEVTSTLTIESGQASLELACNTGSAPVQVDQATGTVKFGAMAVTQRACVDPSASDPSAAESQVNKVEATVAQTLGDNEVAYSVTGNELQLSDGRTTLTYQAG